MAVQSSNFTFLENLPNSVFFATPNEPTQHEVKMRDLTSFKIETLIQELKEKGPIVAVAQIGPGANVSEPFKLADKVHGQDTYGWKPGTEHIVKVTNALILGAKKTKENKEYVYYALSEDITSDSLSKVRKHILSTTDKRIYVISFKTFANYLQELHPPYIKKDNLNFEKLFQNVPVVFFSTQPKTEPKLSPSEKEYALKLCQISPLDSILDQGEGERKCKAIGQEIFDKYKREAQNNSFAGKDSAQRICDAVVFSSKDGKLRKQYIERAWDGIGDDNWRWLA